MTKRGTRRARATRRPAAATALAALAALVLCPTTGFAQEAAGGEGTQPPDPVPVSSETVLQIADLDLRPLGGIPCRVVALEVAGRDAGEVVGELESGDDGRMALPKLEAGSYGLEIGPISVPVTTAPLTPDDMPVETLWVIIPAAAGGLGGAPPPGGGPGFDVTAVAIAGGIVAIVATAVGVPLSAHFTDSHRGRRGTLARPSPRDTEPARPSPLQPGDRVTGERD